MKLPSLVALPTIGDPSGMTGWRTKRKQLEDAITQNENVMSGQGETTTDTVNRPDRLQQIADNLGALSALDQPRLLQGTSPIYPQVIAYSGSLGMYGAFLDMVQAQLNACPVAIESSVGGVHVYARGQANRLVGFHWDANHVSNWFLASRIFTPKTGASASLYVKRRDARYGNVRIVITAVKVKEDEKPAKTPRVDLIVEGDRDGVKDIETWSGLPESAADAVAILSGEQNSASPYNYATSAKITATTEPNPLRRGSLILSLLVNGIGTLSPGEVLLDAVKGEAGLPRFSLNRSSRALQVDGRPATLPAHIAQSTPDHTSAGTGLAVELWLKPTTALASAPSRLEKYRNPPTIAPGALQLLQYHNDSTSLADGDILRPSSISLTLTPEMGSQSERKVPDYVKQMLKMSYGIEGNFCK